jgi:hypothetical protein
VPFPDDKEEAYEAVRIFSRPLGLNHLRVKPNFLNGIKLMLPVQSCLKKYFP